MIGLGLGGRSKYKICNIVNGNKIFELLKTMRSCKDLNNFQIRLKEVLLG